MLALSGSVESCDCLITLYDSAELTIDLDSIVIEQFGSQIMDVVKTVLASYNISQLKVVIVDKGALDYTIKARLITALTRGNLI